jgi:hypothetical protein
MFFQPIETAPPDNTRIILARYVHNYPMPLYVVLGFRLHSEITGTEKDKAVWYTCGLNLRNADSYDAHFENGCLVDSPTHWMYAPELSIL